MSASKLYILDTNVLLHDPKCLVEFKEQDIAIPMTVLEELDDIKDRKRTSLLKRVLRFERSIRS